MSFQRTGKVWVFGNDINTDLIQPSSVVLLPIERQVSHVFEANRPGWVTEVQEGDVIVGGRNFGTGSSRPAAKVLLKLGIAGVIAESINGLFFRNCVNFGLPALELDDARERFAEGDLASFNVETGGVANQTTGTAYQAAPWAPALLEILAAGGLMEQLESEELLLSNTTGA